MKLASLSELKTHLEITDSNFDSLLTQILSHVSQAAERYLNRKLKKQERTEYFDSGVGVVCLSAYPVDEESDLTVKIWGSEKTKDVDYYLYPDIGVIQFTSGTGSEYPRKIEITYTGGYEESDGVIQVPDDIKHAVILQAAYEFLRRRDFGLSSVALPDGSISVSEPANLLPEVKRILDQHRRILIG